MDQETREIIAAAVEATADLVYSSADTFPDIGEYDEKHENGMRHEMELWVGYAEEGSTGFDPSGKYPCGTCHERIEPNDCRWVEGPISMEAGSCRLYQHNVKESNTTPAAHRLTQIEAQYGERPKTKAFGCSRCEYGAKAKKPDSAGRPSWCRYWGVHVQPLACCAVEEGKDSVEAPGQKDIKAGGPGSGRHKEFNKLYKLHDEIQDGEWTDRITNDDTKHSFIYATQKGMLDKLQQGLVSFTSKLTTRDPDDAYASTKKPHPMLDSLLKDGDKSIKNASSYADKRNYRYATIEQDNALNYFHNALERIKGIISPDLDAATETSYAGDQSGSIWNGIKLIGFTGPEEEGVRAMLSRVPPELLFNVKEVQSAKELGAKHGKFLPETKTMLFNPANFTLRQRFGQGDFWLYHPELTVVHEVGHSIYESLPPEEKQGWWDTNGWMQGTGPTQELPYRETRPGWEPGVSLWTCKKNLKTPRYYSKKNPNEHFADCFAYYILGRAYQMADESKAFIKKYIEDHVQGYNKVQIESPSKPYIYSAINKELENLYNITAGGPGSGRHKGPEKEKQLSDRAQRAKASYVPQTKGKNKIARLNEEVVAKLVGGNTTGDNKPFDVLGKKFGIEVKTIFPGAKNDKITQHPESLARKAKAFKQLGLRKTYTVAIDMRNMKSLNVYFKKGLGSFRLGSMINIGGFNKLRGVIK